MEMKSLAVVLVLAACGNPPDVKKPTGGGSGSSGQVGTSGGGPTKPTAGGTIKDVGCPSFSCAYHAGVGQYFTCLSGGAGACFHFGGACMPDNNCMYDSASKTYKTCSKGAEGLCQTWGAACAPANKCMIDPTDGLSRTCDDPATGSCKRFGALCAP
jgi:hypothetical protein